MKLKVIRKWCKAEYTIGELYVDGVKLCNTLEDTDRGLTAADDLKHIKAVKVYGKTAIPKGTYKVILSYSPKFGARSWAKKYGGKLPELLNVPGFEAVRIHVGNTPADTLGCLLVGKNTIKGQLTSSTACFCSLMDKYIIPAAKRGEEITITYE